MKLGRIAANSYLLTDVNSSTGSFQCIIHNRKILFLLLKKNLNLLSLSFSYHHHKVKKKVINMTMDGGEREKVLVTIDGGHDHGR